MFKFVNLQPLYDEIVRDKKEFKTLVEKIKQDNRFKIDSEDNVLFLEDNEEVILKDYPRLKEYDPHEFEAYIEWNWLDWQELEIVVGELEIRKEEVFRYICEQLRDVSSFVRDIFEDENPYEKMNEICNHFTGQLFTLKIAESMRMLKESRFSNGFVEDFVKVELENKGNK